MNTHSQVMCLNDGDAFEVRNAWSGNTTPASWFLEWASGGLHSDAGVHVNGYTALTHCPLWQGVNIIAGDIGQTPVRLVRNKFNEQRSHPSWNLLRLRPNQLQNASVWKETVMQWALIWGNGVSWIRRKGGRPVDLIPLRPDCLWPELVEFDDGQVLLYHYNSYTTGKHHIFFPDDVLHIQGLTSDGIWGYALYEIARNTIGHGLAIEKHGNKSFANSARPSGVLKHPGKMPQPDRANLRQEWNALHSGAENAGNIAILWEGMEFQAMQNTHAESQLVELKRIGVYEAASLLNLPPHKLGAMEDSSVRANLEEQNADYVQRSLRRWYNRLAEEFARKLLTEKEYITDEFIYLWELNEFLKGDIDTHTTVLDRLVKAELLNRNEAREEIGKPPYEGGEKFGSPAINPQPRPGDSSGDSKNDSKNDSETPKNNGKPVQNQLNGDSSGYVEWIEDRLLHLLECEATRVRNAAKHPEKFVRWLDKFYCEDIDELTRSIMDKSLLAGISAGIDTRTIPSAVISYAKQRHNCFLDTYRACGSDDELPATVDRLLNSDRTLIAQGILATALGGTNGTQNH